MKLSGNDDKEPIKRRINVCNVADSRRTLNVTFITAAYTQYYGSKSQYVGKLPACRAPALYECFFSLIYVGHCTVTGLCFINFFTDLSRWRLSQLHMGDGRVHHWRSGQLIAGYLSSRVPRQCSDMAAPSASGAPSMQQSFIL